VCDSLVGSVSTLWFIQHCPGKRAVLRVEQCVCVCVAVFPHTLSLTAGTAWPHSWSIRGGYQGNRCWEQLTTQLDDTRRVLRGKEGGV